jgi:hypothetical protein
MMKSISWRLSLAAACAVFTLFSSAIPVSAAEPDQGAPADRLERLERRVNEMAQRQEQLMQRLGAQQERGAPMAAPDRENFRARQPQPGHAGFGQPMPPAGAPELAEGTAPSGTPAHDAQAHKDIAGLIKLCFLVAFIFNILVAIWIFTDIRKRSEGSGIFIVLALLAGVPAAIIYALVRIGDKRP